MTSDFKLRYLVLSKMQWVNEIDQKFAQNPEAIGFQIQFYTIPKNVPKPADSQSLLLLVTLPIL